MGHLLSICSGETECDDGEEQNCGYNQRNMSKGTDPDWAGVIRLHPVKGPVICVGILMSAGSSCEMSRGPKASYYKGRC